MFLQDTLKKQSKFPQTVWSCGEFYVWSPSVFVSSLTAVIQNPAINRDGAQGTVKPEKESDHV